MRDPEIEELRDKGHCAVVLGAYTAALDARSGRRAPSFSLKYRRGKGEILIVSHGGRGWWGSDQRRQGRCVQPRPTAWSRGSTSVMSESACANFAGLSPSFPIAERAGAPQSFFWTDPSPNVGLIGRPCGRIWPTWRYLARKRFLSIGDHRGGFRGRRPGGGPRPQAAQRLVRSFQRRGFRSPTSQTFAGRLTKASFPPAALRSPSSACPHRFNPSRGLVLAEAAIDALSLAAIEKSRADTLYAASGGGMGLGTIAALEALLTGHGDAPGRTSSEAPRTQTDRAIASQNATDRSRKNPACRSLGFGLQSKVPTGNDVLRARSSQHQGSTS